MPVAPVGARSRPPVAGLLIFYCLTPKKSNQLTGTEGRLGTKERKRIAISNDVTVDFRGLHGCNSQLGGIFWLTCQADGVPLRQVRFVSGGARAAIQPPDRSGTVKHSRARRSNPPPMQHHASTPSRIHSKTNEFEYATSVSTRARCSRCFLACGATPGR